MFVWYTRKALGFFKSDCISLGIGKAKTKGSGYSTYGTEACLDLFFSFFLPLFSYLSFRFDLFFLFFVSFSSLFCPLDFVFFYPVHQVYHNDNT